MKRCLLCQKAADSGMIVHGACVYALLKEAADLKKDVERLTGNRDATQEEAARLAREAEREELSRLRAFAATMRGSGEQAWQDAAETVQRLRAELDERTAEVKELRAFAATAHGAEAWQDATDKIEELRAQVRAIKAEGSAREACLKTFWALPDCLTCGASDYCRYAAKPGQVSRINCPLWEKKEGAENEKA